MKKQKKGNYQFHPELRLYAKMNVPIIPVLLPAMQKVLRLLAIGERSDRSVKVQHRTLEAAKPLRVTIYTSRKKQEKRPCILLYHGGGFVYPASLHHYVLARKLAKETGAKVFLADYRLAPSNRFPAAAEDAFFLYQWSVSNAEKIGIDRRKIAVCGDSAGGNLAVAVCLWAREKNLPMPCAQVLIYPFLDGRMETESMQRFTDTPMCSTRAMRKYIQQYLPKDTELLWKKGKMREYFSPMETDSVEGLPPAFLETAQYDCLRDEGIAFGKRLEQAGIPTELHRIKGAMHGYDIATGTKLVKRCMEQRIAFLKKCFEEESK